MERQVAGTGGTDAAARARLKTQYRTAGRRERSPAVSGAVIRRWPRYCGALVLAAQRKIDLGFCGHPVFDLMPGAKPRHSSAR